MDQDGFWARLWAVFARPGQAMEWIRERPRWLVGGLILMAVVGVFTAATIQISGPEQMEVMRDSRLGRLMGQEDWQQEYENQLNPAPLQRIFSGVSAAVVTWITVFIYGLFFLLLGKLAGGNGSFAQVMGVTYWSFLIPYGLGYLLRLPLIFAKGSVMEVSLGLAALLPGAPVTSFGYQFLSFFGDFFIWWGLIVAIIGFQKVHGFGRGQAIAVTILPWLLITGTIFGLTRLAM